MLIEVSNGEILDKLSILAIKKEKIKDAKKLLYINREYDILYSLANLLLLDYKELYEKLKAINSELWNIEDTIRSKERTKEFDSVFIKLARGVYIHNDIRAQIKKKINLVSHSHLSEEKSYEQY